MDLGDIIGKIAGVAPWIASALGGPLVGSAVNVGLKAFGLASTGDPEKDKAAFQGAVEGASPDQLLLLKKADQDFAIQMQALGFKDVEALNQLAVQNAADVNLTMQAEAKSEHFVTYAWRPAVGFAVALTVVVLALTIAWAYASVMFWGGKPEMLQYIPGMLGAMAALLAVVTPILGIASWFRGKKQVEEVAAK